MKASLRVLLVLILLPAAAQSGQQAASMHEQAATLRGLRDRIEAAAAPGADLYRQYFEAFPATFTDLQQMLVTDRYRDVLLHSGEQWDFGQTYVVLMCRSYDFMDHRQYARKLLRVGVGADDWGVHASNILYRYAGDIYHRLIFRYACAERSEQAHREQMQAIYAVLPEFTDAQLTAIYHSLTWAEAEQKVKLDWFLNDICSMYPVRCELTRTLRATPVASGDQQAQGNEGARRQQGEQKAHVDTEDFDLQVLAPAS
jgi:hypothetical protein